MTTPPRVRIVATAPIDKVATEILEQIAAVETAASPDEDTMMGLLDNTVGLVCRGGEARITARIIEACPTLRVIGCTGAGFDAIDFKSANARRVPVVFAPP